MNYLLEELVLVFFSFQQILSVAICLQVDLLIAFRLKLSIDLVFKHFQPLKAIYFGCLQSFFEI